MRQTTLKRTPKGYVRSIGKRADGTQPKFLLGHDRIVAEQRLEAITALWIDIEKRPMPTTTGKRTYSSGTTTTVSEPAGPWWTSSDEAKAKAIAKGQGITVSITGEKSTEYFDRINRLKELAEVTPEPKFGTAFYEAGKRELMRELGEIKTKLFGDKSKTKDFVGQRLFEAIEAFRNTLLKGTEVRDGEKTLYDQLKILPSYLADCDLGELDYMATDAAYGVFRDRAKSLRYEKGR